MKPESIVKINMSRSQKECLHSELTKNLEFNSGDNVLIFGMGNFYTFNKLRRDYPNMNVYAIEDTDISYMTKLEGKIYYTNNRDINYIKDTIERLLKENRIMSFDKIIMNPPYDGSLHLKIVSECLNHIDNNGEIVNLSPIRWLEDPLVDYKANTDWRRFYNIRNSIKSITVIPKNEVFRLFDIMNSENLGIYHICKNSNGFKEFESKLLCKKCFNKIKDNLCQIDHNMKDGWRIRISIISNSNHRIGGLNNLGKLLVFKDGMKNDSPWHNFYQKNKWSKTTPEITESIRFNTENEAINFIKSVEETKFGRWYEGHIITDIHISNMNILWLDDYTHPWTDEMLYEYFGLTDDEIKLIEETIK